METIRCDAIVIGAGIAGASAAAALSGACRVVLLEREDRAGYHSTGRSAALLTESYGNDVIRRLTLASRGFLRDPPPGFAERSLLTPRGVLWLADAAQRARMEAEAAAAQALVPEIRCLEPSEALALCPVLRRDYVAGAILEPAAQDIDVAALHQGYLRQFRHAGGQSMLRAEVTAVERTGAGWRVATPAARVEAPILVNAAGAWADVVARLAGVAPLGLVPKRRTAFTFAAPEGRDIAGWPLVIDLDEAFYFKPEGRGILGSPADETPVEPQDVQPEELDIAIALDRILGAADFEVRHLLSRWAGLRSFFPDKSPVVGEEPSAPGFFWLAGQGGYGIMTSPALSEALAGLVLEGELPQRLREAGLEPERMSPRRLRVQGAPA